MTHLPRSLQQTLILLVIAGTSVAAQQPPQFKASIKMKDGSTGSTSSGTMYFGGAKMRAELTSDGQNVIVLVDAAAKTQYMLMPSEKAYMQMAIGKGPGSMTITGPSDPANPCAGGSGNTDCVRGESERVNGYDAVRWDYTNSAGVRTRSWISTRLRFPIKVQDDDGSLTEFTNIAEGPQAATLFSIPAGYQKMDVAMMGGPPGGSGRGRGNANDPMAAAMANMPPELQAQMAAAMRGEGPKGSTAPASAGTAGSGWEKTKGWVINLTVEGTTPAAMASTKEVTVPGEGVETRRETYSLKIVGAIPLNVLGGASGMPGAPGPSWQLMYTDAIGSREVLATPATFNAEVSGRIDRGHKGSLASVCQDVARAMASGFGVGDPSTSVAIVKGDAQFRVPITKRTYDANAEGNIRISGDLKTYDLAAGFTTKGKETTETRTDTRACKDGKLSTKNETNTAAPDYQIQFDFKGLPLPSTVGPVSGSKKMPVKFDEHQFDATVSWTIAPIR